MNLRDSTNDEIIGRVLKILNQGLVPFIVKSMLTVYGAKWLDLVKHTDRNPRDTRESKNSAVVEPGLESDPRVLVAAQYATVQSWDTHRLLALLIHEFDRAFARFGLTPRHRALLFELRQTRHDWAHQQPLTDDEVWRVLDNAERLLTAVGAELESKVLLQSRHEYTLVMAERIFARLTEAQQQGLPLFPNLVNYKVLDANENLQRLLQQMQVQQTPAPSHVPTNTQVSNASPSHVPQDSVEMMEW